MDTPRTPYRDTDPETVQAVYASYGRMMLGAPAPEGSVTIAASDADDFRRQWRTLFDDDGGEDVGGAPDHPGAAGP